MKQVNTKRPLSVLWFVGRWFIGLWFIGSWFFGMGAIGAGSVYAATPDIAISVSAGTDSEIRFQQLDAEVEQILNDVVSLGADMAVLEETRELSSKTQLLVLVSVEPTAFFQLDSIQLQIGEQTASFHQYAKVELEALSKGGSHRLFWDNVPAGRHQLTAVLMGRVPKDPDFQLEATLVIISGVGRRVVELRIATGKNQAFPELSFKEWK